MAYQDVTRRADAVTAGIRYANSEMAEARAAVARGYEAEYIDHIAKLQARLDAVVGAFDGIELADSTDTKQELNRLERISGSVAQQARVIWRQIDKIEARQSEGGSE